MNCLCAGVWWFPPLVLQMAALALSACWGFLIFGISYYAWHAQLHAQAVCFPSVPAKQVQASLFFQCIIRTGLLFWLLAEWHEASSK